ncbi:MAG: hypothetical protein R8N23_16340 [Reichenbachiella sp.]|uniref:hypothetical protein n=1 Tax=Reichenbachiella sp. TaxID=2184521 RepID=UPI002966D1A3|nr:hypothetical protein [Reichenbachiella sp.]MDW3211441.1 hypothetical protein [Reichenbachiella sp.]
MNLQIKNIKRIENSERWWNRVGFVGKGFSAIATTIFLTVMISRIINGPYDHCEFVEQVRGMEFYGTITDKMDRRWNHNSHGLTITNVDGSDAYLYLVSDLRRGKKSGASYLWTISDEGDSVRKSRGTLDIYVKKNGEWENQPIVFATKLNCP